MAINMTAYVHISMKIIRHILSKPYLHVPPVNFKFTQQQNNAADCGISYIIPGTTSTV
jgi:hypothetical protein